MIIHSIVRVQTAYNLYEINSLVSSELFALIRFFTCYAESQQHLHCFHSFRIIHNSILNFMEWAFFGWSDCSCALFLYTAEVIYNLCHDWTHKENAKLCIRCVLYLDDFALHLTTLQSHRWNELRIIRLWEESNEIKWNENTEKNKKKTVKWKKWRKQMIECNNRVCYTGYWIIV